MTGLERGPDERRHVPGWRRGCWRWRPATCCWLCWARLLAQPVRRRWGGGS